MKKMIFILLFMMLLLTGCQQAAVEADEESQLSAEEAAEVKEALNLKHELRFGEDGKFRILVISDVQENLLSERTIERIQTLVDRENPDLVLFGGDNSYNLPTAERLQEYLTGMVGYIENRQIPWAHVFGNHDTEKMMTREEQEEIYESFEYCLSKKGNVTGVGNYVLPILRSDSDSIAFNVFALDSGAYNLQAWDDTGNKYDYIHYDQIQWYLKTSELLEKYNGTQVPAMMLFHIPLQESDIAWQHRELLEYEGECREAEDGLGMNSGLFAAALDRGDVKLIMNGHDHINNAMIEYFGIKLCYSMTVGSNSLVSYYDEDMLGGRVVVIDQNDSENIETYLSYVEY